LKNKKIIFFHGYGGEPIQQVTDALKYLGATDVIQTHIDYDYEWGLDKGKSLFEKSVVESSDCDLIIGLSMGGYTAHLVANKLQRDCIIINPGLDRMRSRVHVKDFDCEAEINKCSLEVYLGDMDAQIPNYYTTEYLDKCGINARVEIIKGMEHCFNMNQFIDIINMSNFND
jgi:hypothetical protein